jgi:hypothetical protein
MYDVLFKIFLYIWFLTFYVYAFNMWQVVNANVTSKFVISWCVRRRVYTCYEKTFKPLTAYVWKRDILSQRILGPGLNRTSVVSAVQMLISGYRHTLIIILSVSRGYMRLKRQIVRNIGLWLEPIRRSQAGVCCVRDHSATMHTALIPRK